VFTGPGVFDLENLFDTGLFADVTFFVEDKTVKCHKIVLSSRCEYFARMFLSGLIESTANEVPVFDADYDVFVNVIKVIIFVTMYLKLDFVCSKCSAAKREGV
jgi:hypothetical protein